MVTLVTVLLLPAWPVVFLLRLVCSLLLLVFAFVKRCLRAVLSVPVNCYRAVTARAKVLLEWSKRSARISLPWWSGRTCAVKGTQTLEDEDNSSADEDEDALALDVAAAAKRHSTSRRLSHAQRSLVTTLVHLLLQPASPPDSDDEGTALLSSDERQAGKSLRLIHDLMKLANARMDVPHDVWEKGSSRKQSKASLDRYHYAEEKEHLQRLISDLDQLAIEVDPAVLLLRGTRKPREKSPQRFISTSPSERYTSPETHSDVEVAVAKESDEEVESSSNEAEEAPFSYPVALSPVSESPEYTHQRSTSAESVTQLEKELNIALSRLSSETNGLIVDQKVVESLERKCTTTVAEASFEQSTQPPLEGDFQSIPETPPSLGVKVGHDRRDLAVARKYRPPTRKAVQESLVEPGDAPQMEVATTDLQLRLVGAAPSLSDQIKLLRPGSFEDQSDDDDSRPESPTPPESPTWPGVLAPPETSELLESLPPSAQSGHEPLWSEFQPRGSLEESGEHPLEGVKKRWSLEGSGEHPLEGVKKRWSLEESGEHPLEGVKKRWSLEESGEHPLEGVKKRWSLEGSGEDHLKRQGSLEGSGEHKERSLKITSSQPPWIQMVLEERKPVPAFTVPPPPLPPKPKTSRESLSPTYDCLTPKTIQQPNESTYYDTPPKRQMTPPPPPPPRPESLYDSLAQPPRYLHEAIAAAQSEPSPELPPRNPGVKWTSIEEEGHRSSRSRERHSSSEKRSSDSKRKHSSHSSSHSRSRSRERSSSHSTERHSEKSRSSERSKDSKRSSPDVHRKHSSKEKESSKKRSPSKEKDSPKSKTDSSKSSSKSSKSEKSPEKSLFWRGSPLFRSASKSSLRSGATVDTKDVKKSTSLTSLSLDKGEEDGSSTHRHKSEGGSSTHRHKSESGSSTHRHRSESTHRHRSESTHSHRSGSTHRHKEDS